MLPVYFQVRQNGSDVASIHPQNTFLGGYATAGCTESKFWFFPAVYSFVGMYFILALIIGVFEGTYVAVSICIGHHIHGYTLCTLSLSVLLIKLTPPYIPLIPNTIDGMLMLIRSWVWGGANFNTVATRTFADNNCSCLLVMPLFLARPFPPTACCTPGTCLGSYSQLREQTLAQLRGKRRVGFLVAFLILDSDRSNSLEPNEFVDFLNDTCNTGLEFDIPEGTTLAVHEFIEMMEELVGYCNQRDLTSRISRLCCRWCMAPRSGDQSSWAKLRVQMDEYFRSSLHQFIMLMIASLYIWVLML